MNKRQHRMVLITLSGIVAAVAMVMTRPVIAADYGGGSVQGYAAKQPVGKGTIVELTKGDDKQVGPATQARLSNMFGVVVDRNQLPITLSSEKLKNETFVAVSGTYDVLVSTQGGSIAAGDFITLSSVDGIGMKAGTVEKTVFGRAAASFDGKDVRLSKSQLKNSQGKMINVAFGSIPVSINIQRNPNDKSTKANVPPILERVGKAIAEKEVSPVRIYLSMAITATSLIAAISVLYSGVRSSIISIGRNPMSKKSIFRAMLEIILTSAVILIIGLFAVYLLLKL